jgi:hypothetical protein
VREAFDEAMTRSTPDVAATLRWLVDNGAEITRAHCGRNEGFGNVLVELAFDGAVLTVTRDRGQWMLDVQSGTLPRFDFDVIHVAVTGHERWAQQPRRGLPEQLPEGASWVGELPLALEWLRTTPDAENRLVEIQQARAARFLGRAGSS